MSALPLSSHLLPEALHLEVGPCKILHPIRTSTGDVIVLVFFWQLYCWNFMSVASLLYVEDWSHSRDSGPLSLPVFQPPSSPMFWEP